MNLTVGMGSIEDYPEYVAAGADEVFCGFVPASWMEKYGFCEPLNRREVLYFNVQLGSFSEMEILADMKSEMAQKLGYEVPVTITLNSPYYREDSHEDILEVVSSLAELGFLDYIVADHLLLGKLSTLPYPLRLHLSGEYGQANVPALQAALDTQDTPDGPDAMHQDRPSIARIIYPRQTSVEDMQQIYRELGNLEYEAFALNEKCQFTGAYCNTYHCDELAHICQLPYELGRDERPGEKESGERSKSVVMDDEAEAKVQEWDTSEPVTGMSGCGLCELFRLREAGVTHLKLVSRGNFKEETIRDIRTVKRALQILESCDNDREYRARMKQELFPKGCSGNCYYVRRGSHDI